MTMTTLSTKPYLIRAIYEWCVDQGFTPHVAVLVDEHVRVPPGYAREGQIVLNIGADATNNLVMGNDSITFQARFGGVSHALFVPIANVLAVYARENGQGMAFEPESTPADLDQEDALDTPSVEGAEPTVDEPSSTDEPPEGAPTATPSRRSHLKIIK